MKIRIFSVIVTVFAGKVPRVTYNYFANESKLSLTHYIPLAMKGEITEMPRKYRFIKQGDLQKASDLLWHRGIVMEAGRSFSVIQGEDEIYKDTLILSYRVRMKSTKTL